MRWYIEVREQVKECSTREPMTCLHLRHVFTYTMSSPMTYLHM
jgi:hypothetical protein